MRVFSMKGNTSKQIHGSHSKGKLEIRGSFHCSGPQPVGVDGGVPQWVGDMMDTHPDIQQIAINGKNGGVVWSRIDNQQTEMVDSVVVP